MSKLFIWSNGSEFFVAENQQEVIKDYLEFLGCSLNDVDPEQLVFEVVPDEQSITIAKSGLLSEKLIPLESVIDFDKSRITATAKRWLGVSPKGFLCSLEY